VACEVSGYFKNIAIPIARGERAGVVKAPKMRATMLRHPYGIGIWLARLLFSFSLREGTRVTEVSHVSTAVLK
jgi:hypothetical protein